MKKIRSYKLILFVVSIFLFCGTISAQPIKIGYVEIKKVFANYKKAQAVETDFKKEIENEQKKISKCQEDIKCMQTEFEEKKDILKPEEKTKKEEEIKTKIQEYFTLANTTNKNLDVKRQELEEKLFEEIKEEVNKYGKEKGITLILDARMILFSQPSIDLTDEIIKILNKK